MAKWANALILDGGSDLLRTRAATTDRIKMHLIKAYTAGDSYSTVVTTNGLGSVSLVAGDIVQSTVSSNRVTTFGAKSITLTANSGASPDLHVAVVDSTTSEVLYVADETTDQVVTSGGTFNVPSFTWTVQQPT
ncbi:MAG TPA: hypothetical protein PLV68_16535 [Ilumatobacteraceae bacterium]|jgi:hypothetical protein|nr:hypothetical protein [Ilumatobacteraceae bacterium]